MSQFGVGYNDPEALRAIEEIKKCPDLGIRINPIRAFGSQRFTTADEAQEFLSYVRLINSEDNMKAVNGIGAQGFFVTELNPL